MIIDLLTIVSIPAIELFPQIYRAEGALSKLDHPRTNAFFETGHFCISCAVGIGGSFRARLCQLERKEGGCEALTI